MSAYLKGCDVVVGDAQDAARALALKEGATRKTTDDGGITFGNLAVVAGAVIVGIIAWPHVSKWM